MLLQCTTETVRTLSTAELERSLTNAGIKPAQGRRGTVKTQARLQVQQLLSGRPLTEDEFLTMLQDANLLEGLTQLNSHCGRLALA